MVIFEPIVSGHAYCLDVSDALFFKSLRTFPFDSFSFFSFSKRFLLLLSFGFVGCFVIGLVMVMVICASLNYQVGGLGWWGVHDIS